MAKEKLDKKKEDLSPAGFIEIAYFDPRYACGKVAVVTCSAQGVILEKTREFREAGGVLRWDGDVRGMPMIDRYLDRRKEILALCPEGYPIPQVALVGPEISSRKVDRMFHENAEKLRTYLAEHQDLLEELVKKERIAAEDQIV